jgi:arginyl-tRNA synthetase
MGNKMNTSEIIKEWIAKSLDVKVDFSVEPVSNLKFGDYSCNIALLLAKKEGKSPKDLADEYKNKLNEDLIKEVEKVESAPNGFLNFFLKKEYVRDVLKKTQKGEDLPNNLKGQKIIIEYTVTNVLKPMHIGHLMGNIIGESLSRIIQSNDAEVKRNNYQGDVGLHIAKAIWGLLKKGGQKEASLDEQIKYIGEAYAFGSLQYEDNEKAQVEIKEINKKIADKSDQSLIDLYKWGREISLKHFEDLYQRLGTKFDYYFFESEVVDDAIKIVKEFVTRGIFEESEGAIVFNAKKYNDFLHTRVFINSQGIPTYEAKDIAHAIRKYKTYNFDKSIIITANEQNEYFKVVLYALGQIDKNIAGRTMHLSHGILKLPDGKMGSRKGNIITGETLISDVVNLVKEKMKDRDFDDEKKNEIAEMVAVGAIKYSILKQSIGSDIIFDFNKSLSFEGDSGPYLQYSAVRAKSILKKAEGVGLKPDSNIPDTWQATNLEKSLERFYSVIERAGLEYAPQYIATYLIELAGEFNSFYAKEKIVDEKDPASPYKLFVTEVFKETMTSGLWLLGIKTPEEM